MTAERLQKVLAHAGVASRRHAEELIAAGRVSVNGAVVTVLGTRVDPDADQIAVDGVALALGSAAAEQAPRVYYMLNKPAGYVCSTTDPAERPSVFTLLPPEPGLIGVGRLDLDTQGLLLITNDGGWAHRVSHPRYEVEKEYRAVVRGVPSAAALRRLREGVEIPGGHTAPAGVRLLHNNVAEGTAEIGVVLHEGRKRQVRLMLAAVGHPVLSLVRVRVGGLQLGDLPVGHYRVLSEEERRSITHQHDPPADTDSGGVEAAPAPPEDADTGGEAAPEQPPADEDPLALRIAVDGPAAAGKSTVGQALAARLESLYVDTGTMYRALTWLAQQRGVDVRDEEGVTALAAAAEFSYPEGTTGDHVNPRTVINGQDATAGMRTPQVDAQVSVVAAYPGVRRALVQRQRALAGERPVVMVGRDIGTVVLTDASLKVYLTASAAERARRRAEEIRAQGREADDAAILAAIEERDRLDSERAVSPLRPAADALIVDTTGLSVPDVVEHILQHLGRS